MWRDLRTVLVVGLVILGGAATAQGASITRTAGGVTAVLDYTVERPISDTYVVADGLSLTVTGPGRAPQTFGTAALRFDFPENELAVASALTIRDLDGNGDPEVLLTTSTGGAHCCNEVRVAWWSAAKGRYVVTSQYWGNTLPRLQDLNKDGRPEFVGFDDRFAYALNASYASSTFPRRVWVFRSGTFVVVTKKYPGVGVLSMNRAWSNYMLLRRIGPKERFNALAAYLASAATAGPRYRKIAWSRAVRFEKGNGVQLAAVRRQVIRLGYGVG